MITLNLVLAEWLKIRKRWVNRSLVLISLAIVVGTYVVFMIMMSSDPVKYGAMVTGSITMSNSFSAAGKLFSAVGVLFAIVFMATNVGSEYTSDTWKMILPRYGNRLSFLATKIVGGMIGMVVMFIVVTVVSIAFAWLAFFVLGLPPEKFYDYVNLGDQFLVATIPMLQMLFYATLAMVATIMTRSITGGIIAGILFPQLLGLLGYISKSIIVYLPFQHVENIRSQWVTKNQVMTDAITAMFGQYISPELSLLIVVGYMALFAVGAGYIFRKRDIAG